MKTSNSDRTKALGKGNIFLDSFKTKSINKLSYLCGYTKRQGGKIQPKSLIVGFMLMISKRRNTYSDWAFEVGLLENKTITKQSLNAKMTQQTEDLVKQVLEENLLARVKPKPSKKINGLLKNFNSVQIDDSSTLHLPDELAEKFPGNYSRGEKKALAKVHALYNLTENNFSFLKVYSFTNNDQSLSPSVLPYLEKGDLCIRDLGFLVLDVLEQMMEKDIYFISRKNYQIKILDTQTEEQINLAQVLRKKKKFDKEVIIGKKQKLKMRLIAIPIPATQANERKRKARMDRDQRLNHSKDYYELLGYAIYITNINPEKVKADEIDQLYRLRWNIEIIFKSWKSYFFFEKLIHRQCTNEFRVKCMIYLMLIYITMFHKILQQVERIYKELKISILKMASFFVKYFQFLFQQKISANMYNQIVVHCAYDKRNDRRNAKETWLKLLN